eukprot:768816-Hanusia_phi.AAC.6
MSGKRRVDVPKRLDKYSVPSMQSFVPKSTISSARERAEILKVTRRDAEQEVQGDLQADEPKLDIFGLRRRSNFDDDDDDDDDDEGGGAQDNDEAEAFWMPGASVPAEKPTTSKSMTSTGDLRAEKNKHREIFDGYHVWHEWMSRTANKPFWHCKETGETRWEPPKRQAVQDEDRAPTTKSTEEAPSNLLEGDFDEEANRRAFLQALYAWRNGEDAPKEEEAGEDRLATPVDPPKEEEAGEDRLATPVDPPKSMAEKVNSVSRAPATGPPSRPVPLAASLHAAASKGEVEMLRDILRHTGADAGERDRFGSTALHYAAGGGHVDAATLLLSKGAKINAQNEEGDSPLHLAAKGSSFDMLVELLEHGADLSLKNKRSNDAAKIARMFGRRDFESLLNARATTRDSGEDGGQSEEGRAVDGDPKGPAARKTTGEDNAAGDVDEDDLASARRQLEALRMRAKEEIEYKYSSRPSTANSSK